MRTIKKPNREDLIETDSFVGSDSKGRNQEETTGRTDKAQRKCALTYNRASHIINRYTLAATAVGALPMPGADVVAVSAIQTDLVVELAREYGLKVSRNSGKNVVAMLAGSMTITVGARTVFSALKTVPFIGSIVGGGTSAIASAATTYTIGRLLVDHFENGGTLKNTMIPIPADAAARHAASTPSVGNGIIDVNE